MPVNKRIAAAIDMGTNTFHLLVAEEFEGKLKEIIRKRVWVNLAEEGIDHICQASLARAWDALVIFKKVLSSYADLEIVAVATEAFRSADNGMPFLIKVNDELNIFPRIIPGSEEAYLIHKGISLIIQPSEIPSLIMDIGGGSTEFILYHNYKIIWSKSYKAGVTYLFNRFTNSDPLTIEDEDALIDYFQKTFSDLLSICKAYKIRSLIGASGSFEVLELLAGLEPDYIHINYIPVEEFHRQFELLRLTTGPQRLNEFKVPETRARMIVVALILMKYIIDNTSPETIGISPYAMKEGMIAKVLNI